MTAATAGERTLAPFLFNRRLAPACLALGLGLVLGLPWPAARAAGQEAAQDEALPPLPPRTIEDVSRLLDHYKPDPGAATRALQAAEAQPPEGADQASLFDFYWRRGRAAAQVGRVRQQIDDLRRARELAAPGSPAHLRALRELAGAESAGGNLLNALRYCDEAIQANQHQKGKLTGAYQLAAQVLTRLGDFDGARERLNRLEGVFAQLQRSKNWGRSGPSWTANYERARGELFLAEGRYVEAERSFRQALKSTDQFLQILPDEVGTDQDTPTPNGVRQGREGILRNLAAIQLARGRLAEAEILARQALRDGLERVGRSSTDTARNLRILALVLAEEGRAAESAQLAQASLASFEEAGTAPDSLALAEARRALGSALVAQGRYGAALTTFEAMRAGIATDPDLLARAGSGDLDWVLALLRTGKAQEAERMAAAMLDGARRMFGDKALRTAEIRSFRAMALTALGRDDEAFQAFSQALPPLLEQAHSDAEADTGSRKRQQRLVQALESYLQLLGRLYQSPQRLPPGFDAAAESFRLADLARSSGVQRALTASAARARIDDPALAELARQEQDAQQRINSLGTLLTQLLSAPPDQQLPQIQDKLRGDIAALRQQREAARSQIARRFPDYAQLVDPQPATLAEARRRLRPGEVLVAWYFGEESSQAWAIPAQGEARFALLPTTRRAMAAEVAGLRRALDPAASTIDEIPPFDTAAANRLYQGLLQPLAPALVGARTLLAVPHAELGQLPLSVLLTAPAPQPAKGGTLPFAGYRDLPWLAKQVAVAQLPSVTALASLRSLKPGPAQRRPFIGFGDPLFSLAQAKEPDAPAEGLATRGIPLKRRNVPHTSGVDSAELAQLPRLPDTGDEIREIARVLGADGDGDVFLQRRASEAAVFAADLADRRVVMFATHGLVPGDLNGLDEPALALTSPAVTGGKGDGLLTLDEILGLKLNADWVVLSACNTAAGDGSGAEAVSGLGRAFFYAGARALLVSNWPVETVAAQRLMTDLFRRQASAPDLSKAEALRLAMLDLLNGPGSQDPRTGKTAFSYAHPLFWAPFVVVGD